MSFHYNIIYNDSSRDTDDSELALTFVNYLYNKIRRWGFKGYYADKHARPGKSVFDELFRIVKETEKTLVVITPHFRSNYWAKYSKQAAFKYLLDEGNQHKLIPIAINIRNQQDLEELNVNTPVLIKGLTELDWEGDSNKNCFERLQNEFLPEDSHRVVEEIGDNRLRTEGRQQLVTRPSSETSLQVTANQFTEEGSSSNTALLDITQSVSSVSNGGSNPNINLHDRMGSESFLSVREDSCTGAGDMFPDKTHDRSLTSRDRSRTERTADQTDGTDLDNEGRIGLRNNDTEDLNTRSDYNSISEDNDLSMDILPENIDAGNNGETLEERPETLGAEEHTFGNEMLKLTLDPFEQDVSNEMSNGSPETDETNPKYAQIEESGDTTPYSNTQSRDGQVPPQNPTHDDKIISYDLNVHSESKSDTLPVNHTAESHQGDKNENCYSGNGKKQSKGATSLSGIAVSLLNIAYDIGNGDVAFK